MEKEVSYNYLAPPSQCHYLLDQQWQLEYRICAGLTSQMYLELLNQGWRRFGWTLFRPRCASCQACQPIRILVDSFRPDRSQRRVQKANADTKLVISKPSIDAARLDLYHRHHQHHAETKGWPAPNRGDAVAHILSIVEGPFPVQEWAYYIDEQLVSLSYVDALADGYSGIYFYHDPELRKLSLGNWICISMIEQAKVDGLPYLYLGYYIKDCRSMEYKGKFAPNQVLTPDGTWINHLE